SSSSLEPVGPIAPRSNARPVLVSLVSRRNNVDGAAVPTLIESWRPISLALVCWLEIGALTRNVTIHNANAARINTNAHRNPQGGREPCAHAAESNDIPGNYAWIE